jgi:hypothetical protein
MQTQRNQTEEASPAAVAAMTGAPIDYSAASDFLVRVHKGITTGSVRLVSFTNDDGEGPAKPLFTRDPQEVEDHCREWDRLGRGMFVSMCTNIPGRRQGARECLDELSELWAERARAMVEIAASLGVSIRVEGVEK